jgi:hypothetical protein
MSMAKTIRSLLDEVGLLITTPHINPGGYGYIWRGRPWVGPFASEYDALKAAFEEAIQIMNSEHPYTVVDGKLWYYGTKGWERVEESESV